MSGKGARSRAVCPGCGSRRVDYAVRRRFLRPPQLAMICPNGHVYGRRMPADMKRRWKEARKR